MDNWGINRCEEVDASLTTVRSITTNGVWGCAIAATANATGDHSGGTHGDEILQSAYFFVDGVYYPQDFVGAGSAKEIKFMQKSTIYIEGSTNVLAYRECTWIFTANSLRLKQKLTFPAATSLGAAWIAMLPILRKANQDNTGAQVTDTEIRSQDGLIINVAEPNFTQRNLAITANDSITLSSATSGISGDVTVNKITAANPQAFVQNTAPYNKIYVSGITIGSTYVTTVNETWEVDATFKVNTRN